MGYLATGEIFENMLLLKGFGLYFEGVMNRKWLLSYRNNDISYRDEMLYVRGSEQGRQTGGGGLGGSQPPLNFGWGG